MTQATKTQGKKNADAIGVESDPVFIEVLLRQYEGSRDTSFMVNWGIETLAKGFDSLALRRLAAFPLDSDFHEVKAVFDQTLGDFGIHAPSRELVHRTYLRFVAQKIVDRSLPPLEGADDIVRRVAGPLDFPRNLKHWRSLAEGKDPRTLIEFSAKERNIEIRNAAQAVLDKPAKKKRARASVA